ncbi:bifunctional 2-polyprenyl-6-hydroxyphenol methylase/3-demethylubiquinol 3-O-methyltransferase UbiG [Geothrix sp. PMB-07]|uniref:class I SAM-dependent methyltransferase n=1 Tax=Geothrix sp. PMB-07 TaxID=3068640 RepID=UPI0027428855|nr:class I SAM-dependent methyltransferase [Geothrix sp. PMB-07]WLT31023.1 class I SAM-dependent methyltransferase [Geothrix sp. PMB-07]
MGKETSDSYGRLDYRGLIAWPERLQREAPLLQRVLGSAPSKRILDLGCGSGEHSRFPQSLGFEVTGVDASASQVQAAREADPAGHYVEAGLVELEGVVEPGQGGALCLGNTLPHLCEEAEVRAFFSGLARCLLPGAPFLLQLLNYDRILDRGERTFPVLLRPGAHEAEDTVFLRLMTHHGQGRITFTPARLSYRPGTADPLALIAAETVNLRGWRRAELEALAEGTGLQVREAFGSMTGEAWSPMASDLVLWMERRSPS